MPLSRINRNETQKNALASVLRVFEIKGIKMPFLGTIVNFFAVLISGIIGALVKKSLPKNISDAIMSGMAVCVIYIGVDGMLEAAPRVVSEGALLSNGLVKILVMIISIALGTLLGELINIDKWVNKLGDLLEKKFASKDNQSGNFSRGFVACSLLFCVGAMTVNGSIADAFGSPDILIAKSAIDGIMVFVMASTLGIGCMFSAFTVLVYQGSLTAIALIVKNLLPAATVSYMSITGSLVIVLIGTNMLGMTKVKTANMVPAMFLPIAIAPLVTLI